ncbi:MAG: hypothetical protein AB1390_03430 [Nitrospirota bacterium]
MKGLLSDSQKAEVEKASDEHPELRMEIEQWKKIQRLYKTIEGDIPQPSSAVYSRVAARIKEHDQPGFFERFLTSRKLTLAFIAGQFLVILALGIYTYITQTKPEYRTLSAPPAKTEDSVKIHIVFKETAAEADIRKLLLQVHARIINGPSRSGLYVIEIPSREDVGKSLSILQGNTIAEVAEKAY